MDMLSELSWLSVMIVLALYEKIVNVGRLRGLFDTRHNDLSTIIINKRRFSTIEKTRVGGICLIACGWRVDA